MEGGVGGQAIEFWVCAALCVCGLVGVVENGVFSGAAAGGRLDGQDGGERGQEWDDRVLLGRKNW